MKKLQCIGFWSDAREGDVSDSKLIHPRDIVDPMWAVNERDKLVSYLKGGQNVNDYLGCSYCRFEGIPDEMMGNSDLSDGVWVWPEGLHIYVERFGIRLPDKFFAHVKKKNFLHDCCNGFVEEKNNILYESSYWDQWCKENRSKFWIFNFYFDVLKENNYRYILLAILYKIGIHTQKTNE